MSIDKELIEMQMTYEEKIKVLEKALELACDRILYFYCKNYCKTKDCEDCYIKSFYTPEHFKREALKLAHQHEDKGE